MVDVEDAYGAERRLAALAAHQRGVVARWQLRKIGVSDRAIGRRIAAGRLHPLHRGVYAVGHEAVTWEGRAVAALLAVGKPAALSHRSAAIVCEMVRPDDRAIHVTVIGRKARRRDGMLVHSARRTTRGRRRGLPVTTPARTLLDLATSVPSAVLERAYAEAQVRRLVTPDDIRAELASHRGAPAMRQILDTTEPTRTAIERRLVGIVQTRGAAAPAVQRPAARLRGRRPVAGHPSSSSRPMAGPPTATARRSNAIGPRTPT